MSGLPGSLTDFGPAALAAVVVATYLVVGEPAVGHVLHRRFENRLRTDPGARRSFYRRLLILEWGLAVLALVIWLSAPGVDAGQVGLRWPQGWPGPVTGLVILLVLLFVAVSTRALRSGVLLDPVEPRHRPGEGRHAESPAHATLALLPRTATERRLFTVVGVTAGICEEWLYRGFFLAVVAAVYLSSGSLLLPVLLHAVIDLRFLLVPPSALPAVAR